MLLRKIASLFLASYAKRKIVLNQETIKADARIVFERLKLVKVPTENLVDVKRVRNKIYYDENIESLELQKMINIYCKAIETKHPLEPVSEKSLPETAALIRDLNKLKLLAIEDMLSKIREIYRTNKSIFTEEMINALVDYKETSESTQEIIRIYYFLVQDEEILKTKKHELSYILGSNVVSDENIKKLIEFRNKNILRLV